MHCVCTRSWTCGRAGCELIQELVRHEAVAQPLLVGLVSMLKPDVTLDPAQGPRGVSHKDPQETALAIARLYAQQVRCTAPRDTIHGY